MRSRAGLRFMTLFTTSASIGGVGLGGIEPHEGEQGDSQILKFPEHAMEFGLVDDWAGQQGVPVGFGGDGHPVEPVVPVRTEMALDPDLVVTGLAGVSS